MTRCDFIRCFEVTKDISNNQIFFAAYAASTLPCILVYVDAIERIPVRFPVVLKLVLAPAVVVFDSSLRFVRQSAFSRLAHWTRAFRIILRGCSTCMIPRGVSLTSNVLKLTQ